MVVFAALNVARIRRRIWVRVAPIVLGVVLASTALLADSSTTAAALPRLLLLWIAGVTAVACYWLQRHARVQDRYHRVGPRISGARIAGGLCCAWTILAACWGNVQGRAECALPLAALLLGYAAHALGQRRTRCALAAAAVTIALVQGAFACSNRLQHVAVVGLSGNPDWLGLTLAPSVLLYGMTAYRQRNGWTGKLLFALFPVPLLGFAWAESRVAWLATALGSLAFFIAYTHSSSARKIPLFASVPSPAAQLFHDANVSASLVDRIWIWQHAFRAAAHAPWFGAGTGRFYGAFLIAQGESLREMRPATAARQFVSATTGHSQWAHALVETGWAGVLLLSAFAVLWLRDARKCGPVGFSFVVVVLACMAGDMAFAQPPFVVLLALGVVVYSPQLRRRPAEHRRLRSHAWALYPAVTAWVAAVATIVIAHAARNSYLSERSRTRAAVEPELRSNRLRHALRRNPADAPAALELASLLAGEGLPVSAELWLAQAAREATTPALLVARGNVFAARSRWHDAEQAYRAALELNAGSLRAHVNLGEICRLRGDMLCAERALRAAAAIAPDHPKVQLLRARLDQETFDQAVDAAGTSTIGAESELEFNSATPAELLEQR
jgi:tetratricopeptide (TPR) repeat protein